MKKAHAENQHRQFMYSVVMVCSDFGKRKSTTETVMLHVGAYLFSRAVASQVSSARQSLTSVFGMGTGGPSALITPTRSIQSFDCTDIVSRTFDSAMHLQGFEPGTH